jgi:hypothetical protein
MVQEHIAKVQGMKAFHEGEQAKKHDQEIDDAQRAITGLPPDWAYMRDETPGTLERPEYEDVSPALNPLEQDELEREKELMDPDYESSWLRQRQIEMNPAMGVGNLAR